MKIAYLKIAFKGPALKTIQQANEIIAEYGRQGFDLTLRQLYYQFVSRGLLPNTERNYKNLGNTLSEARLAGLVSWVAIEDRTRPLHGPTHWIGPDHMVRSGADTYAIDKWEGQDNRVEIWVEKEALEGVIAKAAEPLDLDFFPCRGYVSQSSMWRAARRLTNYEKGGQDPVVLYLGDHDPSGIDMTRDIKDRLALLGCKITQVERIALTLDQVREHNPPPNPAKVTDSRYQAYMAEFGEESWELDALEPAFLVDLISKKTLEYRDQRKWDEALRKETKHKVFLDKACGDIEQWLEDEDLDS
jgi:hypothetical protein